MLVETFWIIIISSLYLHRVKKKEAVVAMLVEVFWIMLGGACSVVAEQRSLSFCEGKKGALISTSLV